MSRALALAVAFLAGLLFLAGGDSLGTMSHVLKPIPVAVLSGLLRFRTPGSKALTHAHHGLALAALADLGIEFNFLLGLAVFLIAHLFYIAAFWSLDSRWRPLRLAPFLIWAAIALPLITRGAGNLAIPVAIYGLVIVVMIWRAAAAVERAGFNAGTAGILGALCFGASDSLLGYIRFVAPLPESDFLVMGTYWLAQSLIAFSFLKREPSLY